MRLAATRTLEKNPLIAVSPAPRSLVSGLCKEKLLLAPMVARAGDAFEK
jgi:hypothetical protein